MLGTTVATVEGPATRFATLTAFGQQIKPTADIPAPADLAGTPIPNPVPQADALPTSQ